MSAVICIIYQYHSSVKVEMTSVLFCVVDKCALLQAASSYLHR